MSSSGGIPAGAVSVATAHLTAAQIGTLFSAPVTLISAPGANRAIDVIALAYETVGGNSAWNVLAGGIYCAAHIVNTEAIDQSLIKLSMLSSAGPDSEIVTEPGQMLSATASTEVVNGSIVVADALSNPVRSAPIATKTINAAGAGYLAGDTGTIDNPMFGTPTGYVVDTVGALGVVTAFHLAASSAGYDLTASPFDTTAGGAQPGIGTGLKVNVLTLAAATGDLYVTVFYKTITTH